MTHSVLSISSPHISHCEDVARSLCQWGIMSSVSPNYSIIETDQKYHVETGCTITLPDMDPTHIETQVWNPLRQKYHLECAHLNVHHQFRGCIKDFFQNLKKKN